MPSFGAASLAQLATCDEDLQRLFRKVVESFDCKVVEGFRGKDAQNYAYTHGFSDKPWPEGNHNHKPSTAADVYPFPIPKDFAMNKEYAEKMRLFAHYVLGVAAGMGIGLRWGGDWDHDWNYTDQSLVDLPHFELLS